MSDVLVKEVKKSEVITVGLETSVFTAVKMMRDKKVGSVIVVDNIEAIGIVTTTDILYRLVATGKDPKKYVVKDIMSSPLVRINSRETLQKAAEMMAENSIKKLPVIEDNGELVGILTAADIIAHKSEFLDILVNLVIPGRNKNIGS